MGRGKLCLKGPVVVQKHLENEKATGQSWDADGNFKTGDMIQVDTQASLMYVVEG